MFENFEKEASKNQFEEVENLEKYSKEQIKSIYKESYEYLIEIQKNRFCNDEKRRDDVIMNAKKVI